MKTAITSLMTAAAAMVPWMIWAHSGAGPCSTDTAMPVNTRDTPECGSRVKPRYLRTVSGAWVTAAPKYAPPYLPTARATI